MTDETEAGGTMVFGGQILAQMIVAAHLDRGDDCDDAGDVKDCKSIHAVFARAGDPAEPVEYLVDRMHEGRSLASDTVTFSQNGTIRARALILWSADEPDLFRHTAAVAQPRRAVATPRRI